MVRSKINAYVILVFLLFSLFTISPWYLFNNEKYYVVDENKIYVNDLEAEQKAKYYNPERQYYRVTKSQYLIEKSNVPFFRKRTLVRHISSELYSKPKR